MISYVTFGANDLTRAEAFYTAFLTELGYGLTVSHEGLRFALPAPADGAAIAPEFYVKPTFNGAPATAGNGTMIAFEAHNQTQVRALHRAAIEAGGTDDGAPGFRAAYGPRFFVGYLRDPDGNKIALYSSHPDDPTRDGP